MSRRLWRIGADTLTYAADDLSGTGAALTGGRWNKVGVGAVYASTSRALACLETIVHVVADILPSNRSLVEITAPDDVWAAAESIAFADLDIGWDVEPPSFVSVAVGTNWAESARSALLFVPSVIVPEEQNVLINPAHPDTARITARKVRRWLYDPRLR